jgi:hypothetical protein
MTSVARFEFPLAKAEYLLTYKTASGVGGDKQNFWRNEMGFESAEAIRESILAEVSPSMLQSDRQNDFGNLYRAYVTITGPSGLSRRIRTVWIVRFNEDMARFVTAVPQRKGGL